MGDMDDGFNDNEVEFITMYRGGHSDGYIHTYGGPLFESKEAADFDSQKLHGYHAVPAKAVPCIRLLRSGDVYIVDGPHKTRKDREEEEQIRKAALAKLSEVERKVLGLK